MSRRVRFYPKHPDHAIVEIDRHIVAEFRGYGCGIKAAELGRDLELALERAEPCFPTCHACGRVLRTYERVDMDGHCSTCSLWYKPQVRILDAEV